jgi:hypothetical protein
MTLKQEPHHCPCCNNTFSRFSTAAAHVRKFHKQYHKHNKLPYPIPVHHASYSEHKNCGCCPDGIIPSNKRKLSAITSVVDHKASNDNPILNLNIMQLTEKDFDDCRQQEGDICIYDGIASFKECSLERARNICDETDEIRKIIFGDMVNIRRRQFTKSDGRMGRTVPCCNFATLLQILSKLNCKKAKILQQEQATIAAHSMAGSSDLEQAMPIRRSEISNELKNTIMKDLPISEQTKLDQEEQDAQKKVRMAKLSVELANQENMLKQQEYITNQQKQQQQNEHKQKQLVHQIDIFNTCKEFMGVDIDAGDKSIMNDWKSNIAILTSRQLRVCDNSSGNALPPEDFGLPVSMLVQQYLGYTPTKELCSLIYQRVGRKAAKYYRDTFLKEPPLRNQKVDGAIRQVKHYLEKDRSWLSSIIGEVCNHINLSPRK